MSVPTVASGGSGSGSNGVVRSTLSFGQVRRRWPARWRRKLGRGGLCW